MSPDAPFAGAPMDRKQLAANQRKARGAAPKLKKLDTPQARARQFALRQQAEARQMLAKREAKPE